ncbi:MAG TPA: FG-GAP-like repeat-containing protein [Pyrinomonadaceae bacterium]
MFKYLQNSLAISVAAILLTLGAGIKFLEIEPGALAHKDLTIDRIKGRSEKSSNESKPDVSFDKLPIQFVKNSGQAPGAYKYYSNGQRYAVYLSEKEALFRLFTQKVKTQTAPADNTVVASINNPDSFVQDSVLVKFAGAGNPASITGENELPGKYNYLVGDDPQKWIRNSSTFEKVRYTEIYPGTDLVFYGRGKELEFDFIVSPYTDTKQINLDFDGIKKLFINKEGDLIAETENGRISYRRPVAYQNLENGQKTVRAEFVLLGKNRVGFRLGKYDRSRELIIDPILLFSSYFGGSNQETADEVRTDANGNIYLVGSTGSANFPTVNPLQPAINGQFGYDSFITKLNSSGTAILYSTYLGGNSDDLATALSVEADGTATVAGRTFSSDFPLANAYQTENRGGSDLFIAKLNPSGSALIFSTYFGGGANDDAFSASGDGQGNIAITGRTDSVNFPVLNPIQGQLKGNYLFRNNEDNSGWSPSAISPDVNTINSFARTEGSPSVIFAGTNSGVFKSSDNGANWIAAGQQTLKGLINKVAVSAANPAVVYAVSLGSIFKSVDAGATWTPVTNTNLPFATTVALDPRNSDTVLVGGSGDIYRTTNGGTTWSRVTPSGLFSAINNFTFDHSNPQTVYALTSGRLFKSVNNGAIWTLISNGLPTGNILDLVSDRNNGNNLFAATGFGLFQSTNAGINWSLINVPNLISVRAVTQDSSNPQVFHLVTSSGSYFRSTDSGASWTQINSGLSGNSLLSVLSVENGVLLGGYTGTDAFAVKFNSSGNSLVFSTFLGGTFNDVGTGIVSDQEANLYLVGVTGSTNFPLENPIQANNAGGQDVFVSKINANGSALVYSTYLGGSTTDSGSSIALDSDKNVYLTGSTVSANYPVQNALQLTCASCASFQNDAFLTKINSAGNALVYSTFLGGQGADTGLSLDVGSSAAPIVVGTTASANFPLQNPVQATLGGSTDAFVTKYNANGDGFEYSTFFGGSFSESATGVVVTSEDNVVFIGQTSSSNLPTLRPVQNGLGGNGDAFIAKIGVDADLEIVKTDRRDPVMVNNPLIYDLQVKNNGLSPATAVKVTDVLPPNTTFITAAASQGNCSFNAGTVSCNLGDLAVNATANIQLSLTPTQAGAIQNTAAVSGNEADSNSSNNSSTQQTMISATPSIAGRITNQNNQPLSQVTVNITGLINSTTQTSQTGTYFFSELPLQGNYTVRPFRENYAFTPRSRTFNSLTRDETADFVAKPCTFTISSANLNIDAAGGVGTVFFTASDPFCAWTAATETSWLNLESGIGNLADAPANTVSGFGSGSLRFTAAPATTARTGTITLGGQTITVRQEGCSFTVSATEATFSKSGGNGSVNVTANPSYCTWTATSNQPWITVTDGNGTGNGTVNFSVSPTTRARRAILSIAGQPVSIWQEADACSNVNLSAPVNISSTNNVVSQIQAFDLNSDGISDIVATEAVPNRQPELFVFKGNGNGTFTSTKLTPSSGNGTTYFALADFNNDNRVDIAASGYDRITIFTQNADGTFSQTNDSTNSAGTLFASDLNRDGNQDLVVANDRARIYLGNGNGTFTAGASYQFSGRYNYSFAIGDINGDGITDIVVGNEEDFYRGRILYLLGIGDGTFAAPAAYRLGKLLPTRVITADLNNDGTDEVITFGFAGQISIYRWDRAAKTFARRIPVYTETANAVFNVGDVNSDGKLDLITTESAVLETGRLNILFGNGNLGFRKAQVFTSQAAAAFSNTGNITIGDFDNNGKNDLAVGFRGVSIQTNSCVAAIKKSFSFRSYNSPALNQTKN